MSPNLEGPYQQKCRIQDQRDEAVERMIDDVYLDLAKDHAECLKLVRELNEVEIGEEVFAQIIGIICRLESGKAANATQAASLINAALWPHIKAEADRRVEE